MLTHQDALPASVGFAIAGFTALCSAQAVLVIGHYRTRLWRQIKSRLQESGTKVEKSFGLNVKNEQKSAWKGHFL